MIGISRCRIFSSISATLIPFGWMDTARLSILSSGRDPPPICDSQDTTCIFASIPVRRKILAKYPASFSISSSGIAIIRRTGIFCTAVSSDRYSIRTISSAAAVNLSIRSARVSWFFFIISIYFFLPMIIPACGPPSSLSPLKHTTSAPCAMDSCTVGSCVSPYFSKLINTPLPRSSTTGIPCSFAIGTSSSIPTLSVNPTIR